MTVPCPPPLPSVPHYPHLNQMGTRFGGQLSVTLYAVAACVLPYIQGHLNFLLYKLLTRK